MNLNRFKAVNGFVLLLLLASAAPRGSDMWARQSPSSTRKSVVFIVTKDVGGEAQVEPLALTDHRGVFEEPISGGVDESALSSFFGRYYQAGTKYRLIYGGAESGMVTIREALRAECAPVAARADIAANVKLGGNVMALATDGEFKLREQSSRRAPTESERAAVFQVAKLALLKKRVSASAIDRNTKTLNLTATDLDGDGREELIGSYVVGTGPQVRDTLFLVAAPRGHSGQQGYAYDEAFAKHERINAKEMMDPALIDNVGEGGLLTELFVEQLDVDGDGVGELFTVARSFEGTSYRTYRRQRGTWRAGYEFYSYRCAY